jgi:hydroxymethylbilane synthase
MMRIGTRGSALALAQANAVATRLTALGVEATLVPMRTEGDRRADQRLADVGGKGLFVRDIELALLRGEIDVAVHSLKDLPAETPPGLVLAAFLEREDAHDVLASRSSGGLAALPSGAVVGTSSPRRRAILLSLRPDLVVEPIRGNVDTRLGKLRDGVYDAIVLAAAGLRRLGISPAYVDRLDATVFVPAVGQGIITVEARRDDPPTLRTLEGLDDRATHLCACGERAYLVRLGGSCVTPMAAHATMDGGRLSMTGMVASEDGRRLLRSGTSGPPARAEALGRELAESLLADGAASITALRPVVAGEGGTSRS